MENTNGNGNTKVPSWLVKMLAVAFLGYAMGWGIWATNKITETSADAAVIATKQRASDERVLEALKDIKTDIRDLRNDLQSTNSKTKYSYLKEQ